MSVLSHDQKPLKSQLWMSQKPRRYIYFVFHLCSVLAVVALFKTLVQTTINMIPLWLHNMCIDRDQKPGQKMKMIDKSRNWNVSIAAPAGKHENWTTFTSSEMYLHQAIYRNFGIIHGLWYAFQNSLNLSFNGMPY